jgi:hypothetical protein
MTAIVAGDILFKLSVTTGAAGNSTAGTPAGSLGKYISTTQLSGTALNNLFDDVSGAENTAGTTDYRCFFIHNSNASNILQNAVVWLSGGDPAGGATITIAVDTTAASAIGSATAQADTVANELTAPTLVSAYSAPTTSGTGIALGNIGIGQCKAVWVKRVTSGAAAVNAETVTFAVTGDTGAL